MYDNLKKKYGQNFLIDKNIIRKICSLISDKYLNIIEIGPGDGRLTDYILKYDPKELNLIEIDKDLIPILNSKFLYNDKIKIVNENILNYPIIENVDLIISNLPYNISSQILAKICLMSDPPDSLILMFQKEFAERLLNKNLNSLNSLVRCFYDIGNNFNVSKNCFRPIPKIDSTVLKFTRKKKFLLNKNELNNFIEFKRNLFSHKRKTLKKLLKNYTLDPNKFDLSKRVEDISLNQLIEIFREVNL
ncbi:16S rRNA (adenine(1518)-N(6)/adenine(1519)-N(6))-dimethyltransferase RsmA [Alphaproteobacteria bacterium]|nr:16S rRNA (adenine(1518)-N(6)/adenine(1519)-N(6))-dimethyltransferase RsmA [Alphaproteobacteria bacterium]